MLPHTQHAHKRQSPARTRTTLARKQVTDFTGLITQRPQLHFYGRGELRQQRQRRTPAHHMGALHRTSTHWLCRLAAGPSPNRARLQPQLQRGKSQQQRQRRTPAPIQHKEACHIMHYNPTDPRMIRGAHACSSSSGAGASCGSSASAAPQRPSSTCARKRATCSGCIAMPCVATTAVCTHAVQCTPALVVSPM